MKKRLRFLSFIGVLIIILTGCINRPFNTGSIHVISREAGSGTRQAFVDIVDITDENKDDLTTLQAVIQNSTNGVMQMVSNDKQAIGYISLGSLNDSVKPLMIDGVEISSDAIQAEEYVIARSFFIAWPKFNELSELTSDFITFIHSIEGQDIVESEGFVGVMPRSVDGEIQEELKPYQSKDLKGTIEVVGSTSVSPILEKLGEGYQVFNPNARITISSNGSSAGLEAARNGTADLGMSSRDLTEFEKEVLAYDRIAMDGLAIIVNKDNPTMDLSSDVVRRIFLGEITTWEEAIK